MHFEGLFIMVYLFPFYQARGNPSLYIIRGYALSGDTLRGGRLYNKT